MILKQHCSHFFSKPFILRSQSMQVLNFIDYDVSFYFTVLQEARKVAFVDYILAFLVEVY